VIHHIEDIEDHLTNLYGGFLSLLEIRDKREKRNKDREKIPPYLQYSWLSAHAVVEKKE